MSGHLLVRRPSPRLADGELTHLTRAPVDADLALRQWEGYVAVFADRGWAVDEVEPADEHPDGVFIEDTVVVSTTWPCSPGPVCRRGRARSDRRPPPSRGHIGCRSPGSSRPARSTAATC